MPHNDNGTRRLRYTELLYPKNKLVINELNCCLRYLRAKILPANPRKDEPFFDVKEDFFPENFYQGPIYAGQVQAIPDISRHEEATRRLQDLVSPLYLLLHERSFQRDILQLIF